MRVRVRVLTGVVVVVGTIELQHQVGVSLLHVGVGKRRALVVHDWTLVVFLGDELTLLGAWLGVGVGVGVGVGLGVTV